MNMNTPRIGIGMLENRKGVESLGGKGLGMGGNGRGKFGVVGMGLWAKKRGKFEGVGVD